MKYLRSQAGFAQVLLVALVLVAIAAAGYFAYQAKKSSNKEVARPTPTVSSSPTPTSTPEVTADWTAYTSADGRFSLKYPKTWVTGDCNGAEAITFFLATVKSDLGHCNSDSVGQMEVMSVAGDKLAESKGDKSWVRITIGGTDGYVSRQTDVGYVNPDYKLAVVKEYLFTKNGRTFEIYYMQDTHLGYPDAEKDFTTMAEKTLKAN
jgi:hypothetical protein